MVFTNEGMKIRKERMKKALKDIEEHLGYTVTSCYFFDTKNFDLDNAYDVSIIWEDYLGKGLGKYQLLDDDNFYYLFQSHCSQEIYDEISKILIKYIEDDIPLYEGVLKMIESLD